MRISTEIAEQTLTGFSVKTGENALCASCTATLGAGDELTVYAYRPVDGPLVSVERLYCTDCHCSNVQQPIRGRFEWVAEARLVTISDVATQSHGVALGGVEIVDESVAEQGVRS